MNYDINIMVNGKKCRQYFHENRRFIEAKRGSEYKIHIKNNTFGKILAVCSVDGLDVLNGKPANEDGYGYVIYSYNSLSIDGFRVSDEMVAKFTFDYKENSYASTKGDGSEKNVGIIGIRIFKEKLENIYLNTLDMNSMITYTNPYPKKNNVIPYSYLPDVSPDEHIGDAIYKDNYSTRIGELSSQNTNTSFLINKTQINCCSLSSLDNNPQVFDMGTSFGKAKESKITEVEFKRGDLILSTDIYYVSRQSLIKMGVPLDNDLHTNFPKSFTEKKYSEPPRGWKV